MSLLRKIEDVFVLLVRIVLLAFSLLVLVAMGSYLWEQMRGKAATSATTVVWSEVQPDMQYVVEETGRDMGMQVASFALEESLSNAQLRPAFQQADAAVRNFVAAKADHHAEVERNNEARGLAAPNPLLIGDAVPTAQQIADYQHAQADQEKAAAERLAQWLSSDTADAAVEDATAAAEASAVAAADSCCSDSNHMMYWTEPVDIAQMLHERAATAQSEHGEPAYAAFIQGAPTAIERVLGDAKLAPKLHDLPVYRMVDMVLTNYAISFSRAISPSEETPDSVWSRFFSSLELTMWSLIMGFLVMVVLVVAVLRIERHLRHLSESASRQP